MLLMILISMPTCAWLDQERLQNNPGIQ